MHTFCWLHSYSNYSTINVDFQDILIVLLDCIKLLITHCVLINPECSSREYPSDIILICLHYAGIRNMPTGTLDESHAICS